MRSSAISFLPVPLCWRRAIDLDTYARQWRIQGVFWLPGNPPMAMIFLNHGGGCHRWHRPSPATYICDVRKPPLRPTLDTPLLATRTRFQRDRVGKLQSVHACV